MVQERLAQARLEADSMLAQSQSLAEAARVAILQDAKAQMAAAIAAVRERIVTDSVRH